ncbi:hypothetical protein QFZ58_000010 [Streptomyces sp. B1I3]|nr:hypothetical protein [Streptomyces sp. B1I3]
MLPGREDCAAGVLPVVGSGIDRPLQRGQVVGAEHVRRHGADRGGDVDGAAVVQDDRRVQHPDQLLQALRTAAGGQLKDDCELVASEAAYGGVLARPGGEPGADRRKGGDARRVPEAVVDGLELVGVVSARVPRCLNAGRPEPARQLIAAAVPHAGSGEAAGI